LITVTAAAAHEESFELDLPSSSKSVRKARRAVAELARRLGAAESDVTIAVSEAVGNAVVHAFREGRSGTIRVFARRDRGRFLVTVADDGIGMTPNPESAGLGFGIPLISKVCDDVRFSSSREGTKVTMCFDIGTEAEGGGGRAREEALQ
jgi:anti-sigma regulatory factor (Ser/Thr protein kinase)